MAKKISLQGGDRGGGGLRLILQGRKRRNENDWKRKGEEHEDEASREEGRGGEDREVKAG